MSSLITRPVLRGFSFGLALVIAVKQWPHIVGMHAHSTDFLALLAELLRSIGAWQLTSLAVGVCALLGLFMLERVRHVPGVMVVIVAGIAAAPWLASRGVVLTGPIHLALELPAFVMPAGEHWLPLVEYALALMFILYAESYSSIRTFALKHDDRVQANRDLIAIRLYPVVMLEGESSNRTVGFRVQNEHQRQRVLHQRQPMLSRRHHECRQFQGKMNGARQHHAAGGEPRRRGNSGNDHHHHARDMSDALQHEQDEQSTDTGDEARRLPGPDAAKNLGQQGKEVRAVCVHADDMRPLLDCDDQRQPE